MTTNDKIRRLHYHFLLQSFADGGFNDGCGLKRLEDASICFRRDIRGRRHGVPPVRIERPLAPCRINNQTAQVPCAIFSDCKARDLQEIALATEMSITAID